MNCQPGDLAICVNTVVPQNEGLIVLVIGRHVDTPDWNFAGVPAWWCECSQPMVWFFKSSNSYCDAYQGPVPDRNLHPIRPEPAQSLGSKSVERIEHTLEHLA